MPSDETADGRDIYGPAVIFTDPYGLLNHEARMITIIAREFNKTLARAGTQKERVVDNKTANPDIARAGIPAFSAGYR